MAPKKEDAKIGLSKHFYNKEKFLQAI